MLYETPAIIDEMVADGSLIYTGKNENGEDVYTLSSDAAVKHPEVWEEQYNDFVNLLHELWSLGYVEVGFDHGEMMVSLNEKSFTPGDDLTDNLKGALNVIVWAFTEAYKKDQ